MIEARVAHVPFKPETFRPPPPTAKSWRFLRENANVKGVRLQYLYDEPRFWPDAFQAVIDGGLEIHGNFVIGDMSKVTPQQVERATFAWTAGYGEHMATVSFLNEVGYAFGDDDISKGGTRDYMKELVENFWLPFIRGVRRANPDIIIGGPDAESADTLQRFVDLVDVDQWLVHPYGEKEIADDEELDYATLRGEHGKPGFEDVDVSFFGAGSPVIRPLIISEIDHQQHKAARARGELRGVATDAEIDLLTAFSIRMRDEFHIPVVTFGTGEYFCTRAPVFPWVKPPQTWSTWTYGEPAMSDAGKRLAAVFASQVAEGRRRAVWRIA